MSNDFDPSILIEMLDRPIAYQRCFVTISKSVTAAVMLSQAIYWAKRTTDADKWFYKSQNEWEEETGLTRSEQETARKKLAAIGVLEEKKQGLPCRLYFRVNTKTLYLRLIESNNQDCNNQSDQFVGIPQTGKRDPCILEGGIPTNNLYTEITSEITSEINAPEKKIEISVLENKSKNQDPTPLNPPSPQNLKFIDPYQRAMDVRQREPEVKKMMDDREFLKFLIPLMKRWDAYKTSCDSSDARKWVRVAIEPKNDKCDSRWDESRDRYQDFLDSQQQRSQQQSIPIAVQELTATAPPAHIRERFKTA